MQCQPWTVRDLRRRWKPTKERLSSPNEDSDICIRMHRAFSWLQQAEPIDVQTNPDDKLIYQWIAFNSLYGQWDDQAREPLPDVQNWKTFLGRILKLDADGHVAAVLEEHRKLVNSIYDDEHLVKFFWEDPNEIQARKSRKTYFDARTWYLEKRYSLILERLVERIYLLRCQLVHGAATYDSQLNRTPLKRCTMMMNHLIPAICLVLIDHGYNEDWGLLCYPPLN